MREQLIFFDHDSSYFEQTHALLRNAGIRELRTMEVDNIEAAKRMVEHRLGVAFLPRTAVVRSVSTGNSCAHICRRESGDEPFDRCSQAP